MSGTVLEAFDLESVDSTTFRGHSVQQPDGRPIFGGQLMGQMIIASARIRPTKTVRSLQTIFSRSGDANVPISFSVDIMHDGATMTQMLVTAHQDRRVLGRGLVLLDVSEADLIRHGARMPTVESYGELPNAIFAHEGSELRIADGVDLAESGPNGPAELHAWARWKTIPRGHHALNQAVAAWYTDSLLISTAMRPHDGLGAEMAHTAVGTTVLTHTLSFHEQFDVVDWHLLAEESTYAGHGRAYGCGQIFTLGGSHVASFVQDAMIRTFPGEPSPLPPRK